MSLFTLTPADRAEWLRLGEIQHDSFKDSQDPINIAALGNVSRQDYAEWVAEGIQDMSAHAPLGHRIEVVTARDENGNIAGWAEWIIPTETGSDRINNTEASDTEQAVPKGADAQIWNEFVAASSEYEKKYLGDRAHWTLLLLVIDPAFQRRGAGKLLVQDGIDRAHASGLPLFVSASSRGSLLYKSLGFEVKEAPQITQAKVVQTMLVKEDPTTCILR